MPTRMFFPRVGRDANLVIGAAALRTLDYGFISVFLGVYLSLLDFSPTQAGIVFSATMLGSGLSNLLASWKGDTIGRKRMFIAMSVLMVCGGMLFSVSTDLVVLALVGLFAVTTSGGGDRTAFISLDTAVLAEHTKPSQRTLVFIWYNLITVFARSLGALLIALPALIQRFAGMGEVDAYKTMFVVYGLIAVISIPLYARLSPKVEVWGRGSQQTKDLAKERGASGENAEPSSAEVASGRDAAYSATRRIIVKMTGLSTLDALGGGFAVRSFVSFWFVSRFGVDLFSISGIFFTAQLLNVASVALAAPVAGRIGLVNTMAFTQVAANLMFIGLAFSPNIWFAVAFFLLHEICNDMDVPARQSYMMAIVPAESRTAMASLNNLGRNAAQTISPTLAGIVADLAWIGAPFVVGAVTKLVYNALLVQMFRGIKPPEERDGDG